jgi:hypothetical protein
MVEWLRLKSSDHKPEIVIPSMISLIESKLLSKRFPMAKLK